jgi:hypothetical protein
MSEQIAEDRKRNREPGWLILLPFEIVGRVLGVTIMLGVWCTLGLFLCSIIAVRALLWTSGKNLVNGFLDRPLVSFDDFNSWILLWPRKLMEFIRWGLGYIDPPRAQQKSPWDVVLETLAMAFFFVTLIWANEVKPGYLPDVVKFWQWAWMHLSDAFITGARIVLALLGVK